MAYVLHSRVHVSSGPVIGDFIIIIIITIIIIIIIMLSKT